MFQPFALQIVFSKAGAGLALLSIAHIPLQRKTARVRPLHCSGPLARLIRIGNANMFVFKKPRGPNASPN